MREISALNAPVGCAANQELRTEVVVANEGALGVPAGVAVDVSLVDDGSVVDTQRVHTEERMLPGQFETFEISWTLDTTLLNTELELRATVDPDEDHNECDDNNDYTLPDVGSEIQG